MKISIIIRTKNEERWITDCLKAVFNQTYKDFEVIINDEVINNKTIDEQSPAQFSVKTHATLRFKREEPLPRANEKISKLRCTPKANERYLQPAGRVKRNFLDLSFIRFPVTCH